MNTSEGAILAKDFGMHNEPEEREIAVITAEIKTLQAQAVQMQIGYAIQIGRRLCEAKAKLPHGRWGEWLKNEVNFSQSTANNMMQIYREYADNQIGLFGGGNSQAFANLTYTKALRLLAIPAEDREEFVVENNVEELSTRELERIIKEREAEKAALQQQVQELQQRAEDAEENAFRDLDDKVKSQTSFLSGELEKARKDAEEANRRAVEAAKKAEADKQKYDQEAEKLRKAAEAAKKKAAKLADQVGQVPPETMERMRQEAEEAAAKAAAEKLEKQVAQAEARAKAAEAQAAAAQAAADRAKKEIELAAPAVTEFKVHFETFMASYNRMTELLDEMPKCMADKMKKAVKSAVEQMGVQDETIND